MNNMQLEFKKVLLLSFGRKATGGTAKFSASLTASIKNVLGWGDMPDWQKTAQPTGKLIASQVELEPKSGIALGKGGVILDTNLIDGFEIIRTEIKGKTAKKTKATKTELHFTVHFQDASGAKKLEIYMLTANVDSSMIVVYEREPEQGELDTQETAEDEVSEEAEKPRRKKRGAPAVEADEVLASAE